jgi:FkbM family methyltransferase
MVRTLLRRIRLTQPLNFLATEAARAVSGPLGGAPEWLVARLPRSGRVTVRFPDGVSVVLRSDGDEWISNHVFWHGWKVYEPETLEVFKTHAKRSRTILDVGAHIGYFSLVASKVNPAARILAFEPLDRVAKRLREHVELNAASNIEIVERALGSREGEVEIYYVPYGIPSSTSASQAFMSPHADARPSLVSMTTLDSVVAAYDANDVDLIKIDTETTEPDILRGGLGVLEKQRPVVICEVLEGYGIEREIQELFTSVRYRFFLLHGDGPIPKKEIVPHHEYRNYLFVPQETELESF